MVVNLRARWVALLQTLWFVPTAIAAGYVGLAVGLVRLDAAAQPHGSLVFSGSAQAARTVLSTIAGSLITVSGLTFSVTMVVLQLTSSQFSPRVVRNYLGDRIAQLTIGSFVGVFAYCLVALRSIGASGAHHVPVPRVTTTVASALALLALVGLVVFIHHIAQLVQASELTARLGLATLAALERLHPEPYTADGAGEEADALVGAWRGAEARALVAAPRPGFVRSVDVGALERALQEPRPRVHVLVAPGDFVGADEPLAETWPADAREQVERALRRSVAIGGERELSEDAHFGVRQLTDIALRALSPSLNDPTTAATCIGYLRSILNTLAGRELPSRVQRPEHGEPLVLRRRDFSEYVDALGEIGGYAAGDGRIAADLLDAATAVVERAAACGAVRRVTAAAAVVESIAEQARREARSLRDRGLVDAAVARFESALTTALPPQSR